MRFGLGRLILACVLSGLAVTACTGENTESTESTSAGEDNPSSDPTATGETWDSLEDAHLQGPNPEAAIQAFSFAVSPLPDVDTPGGEPPLFSGPIALSWIVQSWDELTSAEQDLVASTIDGLLPQQTGNSPFHLATTDLSRLFLAADDATSFSCHQDPTWDVLAEKVFVDIGIHVIALPNISVSTCLSPNVNTITPLPLNANRDWRAGKAESCVVIVPESEPFATQVIGHEQEVMAFAVFDCVMAGMAPDIRILHDYPSWIRFGADRWVATKMAGSPLPLDEAWEAWLASPETPLFNRNTDAVGFYELISDTTGEEFGILPLMLFYLTATGNAEPAAEVSQNVYDIVVNDDALTSWGGVYLNDRDTHDNQEGYWFLHWPETLDGLPLDPWFQEIDHSDVYGTLIENGHDIGLHADAYTAIAWWLDMQADVVVLELRPDNVGTQVKGVARYNTVDALGLETASEATFEFTRRNMSAGEPDFGLHGQVLLTDDTYIELPAVGPAMWCTLASDCSCPGGSVGADRELRRILPGTSKVSLTGHKEGTVLTVHGYSLQEFCDQVINRRPVRYEMASGEWSWAQAGAVAVNGCSWPSASGSGTFGDDAFGEVEIDWYSDPVRWRFNIEFSTRLEPQTVDACFAESGQRKYDEFEWEPLVVSLWDWRNHDESIWVEGTACGANSTQAWDENQASWEMVLVDGPCVAAVGD